MLSTPSGPTLPQTSITVIATLGAGHALLATSGILVKINRLIKYFRKVRFVLRACF